MGCENVSLGTGDLYINGIDIGFLKGKVTYNYESEVKDLEGKVPKQTLCRIVSKLGASLTAGAAEISAENLARALGQQTVHTVAGGSTTVSDGANEERTFVLDPVTGLEWFRLGPGFGRANTFATLVVENVGESTTYVDTTDYTLDATTGIVTRVSGGSIPSGATVRVSYGYNAVAGKLIKVGASFALNEVEVNFVHTKPNSGKNIYVCIWKATVSGRISLDFSEDDYIVNNIEFKAVRDTNTLHAAEPFGYLFSET